MILIIFSDLRSHNKCVIIEERTAQLSRPYILLSFVDIFDDQINNTVLTELGGVDAQVVVFRHAPFLTGVEAVIVRSAFIGLVDDMLGVRGIDPVPFDGFAFAVFHIGVEEDVHAVSAIPQHIVGTTTDYDTALLFGDFTDDFMLQNVELVVDRKIAHHRKTAAEIVHTHRQRIEEAVGCFFVNIIKDFRAHSALFCRKRDELFIIKRYAEFLRKLLADCSAAAAELSADRNDEFVHIVPLF